MSHYTAIKTKYKNLTLLRDCINKLSYAYSEHKKNLEISLIPTEPLTSQLYCEQDSNHLSLKLNNNSYDVIADFQSWTHSDKFSEFLKKLELNYGYSETLSQALELGFTRSKRIASTNQKNKFVFQRCIEIKD